MISGKRYKAGSRIMLPYRQLATKEQPFGHLPESFLPERFLENQKLRRDRNFKPFGGGKHVCPGRFVTQSVVMVFVALVCYRFDITALGPLPSMDFNNLFLGVMDPVKGKDFLISIQQRTI
jgi:cytochrome P450